MCFFSFKEQTSQLPLSKKALSWELWPQISTISIESDCSPIHFDSLNIEWGNVNIGRQFRKVQRWSSNVVYTGHLGHRAKTGVRRPCSCWLMVAFQFSLLFPFSAPGCALCQVALLITEFEKWPLQPHLVAQQRCSEDGLKQASPSYLLCFCMSNLDFYWYLCKKLCFVWGASFYPFHCDGQESLRGHLHSFFS